MKKIKFIIFRFLAIWIIPSILLGSVMYIKSKLTYMFKWGDDWNSNRYYTLLSFLEITLFIFLCVALIYIFIYWFLNTQLQIALNNYKKTFQFTWSIIFGIGMSLLVNFNSFGFRTFFDFMKMFIIMGLIGWLIPFLDFKLKKYK